MTSAGLHLPSRKKKKGILRVVQMGGSQALDGIADFNEDVGRMCTYCHEAVSTSDHIKWECKYFGPVR